MLVDIKIPPGVVTETAKYTAGQHYVDSDKIRFYQGLPEVIGGWTYNISATSQIQGTTRVLHAWQELDGIRNIGAGGTHGLFDIQGGTIYDITPIRASGTFASGAFTTASGSATVTVTATTHGAETGDRVIYSSASTFNGIDPNGTFTLTKVDSDSYTFSATSTATGTGVGGGGITVYKYTINTGNQSTTFEYGWGAGAWGASTWGTARSSSTVTLGLRTWSLDNWGEDLIANPRDGAIYVWDSSGGTAARASTITSSPSTAAFTFVSEPDRHLIALGAHDGSTQDKMLVRWSDQEDYNTWTATATTTAGSMRLAKGSKLVSGRKARGLSLLWTDTSLYGMQFRGPPYTFEFQPLGDNCGAIGPQATVCIDSVAYWMGRNAFFTFNGSVAQLDCPVNNYVFDNMNTEQFDKVHAFANPAFNEVSWLYQSATGTECDRYVSYNMLLNCWYYGTIDRTAWAVQGIYPNPIAISSTGTPYTHEDGYNDAGDSLNAYLETGAMALGEGDQFTFVDKLIPDLQGTGAAMEVSLYTRRYPNSVDITKGPYDVTATTEKVSLRARGRQFRMRWASKDNVMDNYWRLGVWRANIQPDGKR